jgi:CheY-like chemotaxis protein
MSVRILSVSYDETLAKTREMILPEAGYAVVTVIGLLEAIEACKEHFDLVIIGHSIPEGDSRAIVAALREGGCISPILSIRRNGLPAIAEATKTVEADPQNLLAGVTYLFAGSTQLH